MLYIIDNVTLLTYQQTILQRNIETMITNEEVAQRIAWLEMKRVHVLTFFRNYDENADTTQPESLLELIDQEIDWLKAHLQ